MWSIFLLVGCVWGLTAAFCPATRHHPTASKARASSSGLIFDIGRFPGKAATATTAARPVPTVLPIKGPTNHRSVQSSSFSLYETASDVAQDAGQRFPGVNAIRLPRIMPAWKSQLTKIGMIAYIAGMCFALPLTLLPQQALYKMGWISRQRKEAWAVRTAGFCARWMLRLIPFTKLNVVPSGEAFSKDKLPKPSIWVCNHVSMLDVFMLLAVDKRLRGKYRRPIKIVYWKQLEDNPVTRLMFTQAGFISVDMVANGSGTANEYDKTGFKKLLKDCKQAFEEGYDIGMSLWIEKGTLVV